MRRLVLALVLCIAVAASCAPVTTEATPLAVVAPPIPHKVVLVGDSLMQQVAAPIAAAVGAERAPYVLTTGTANVQDHWWEVWPPVIAAERPDVVAVLVGPWEIDRPDLGSYPWALWYADRLDRWAALLTAGGATVHWILPPTVRDPETERRMALVRDAYRALAIRRDDVRTVDADEALVGGSGYLEHALDGRRLRQTDGLHLCPLGVEAVAARLLAVTGIVPTDTAWPAGPWRAAKPAYLPVECPGPV